MTATRSEGKATPLDPAVHPRVIVITGAASGIGAAVARGVAAPGISLLLHTGGGHPDSRDRLASVAESCRQAGAACATVTGDLAESGRPASCVAAAQDAFGRVDQLVHSAGLVRKSPFGMLSRDELDLCMSVMPGAFLDLVNAALPDLRSARDGRVVAVTSFTAHKIEKASVAPASAAAKAALEVLAKCLALQMATCGTTVNCVSPGYTQKDRGRLGSLTPEGWAAAAQRTPSQRLATADDVAAAILFLLSSAARHITGITLNVDGGLTLG